MFTSKSLVEVRSVPVIFNSIESGFSSQNIENLSLVMKKQADSFQQKPVAGRRKELSRVCYMGTLTEN